MLFVSGGSVPRDKFRGIQHYSSYIQFNLITDVEYFFDSEEASDIFDLRILENDGEGTAPFCTNPRAERIVRLGATSCGE